MMGRRWNLDCRRAKGSGYPTAGSPRPNAEVIENRSAEKAA